MPYRARAALLYTVGPWGYSPCRPVCGLVRKVACKLPASLAFSRRHLANYVESHRIGCFAPPKCAFLHSLRLWHAVTAGSVAVMAGSFVVAAGSAGLGGSFVGSSGSPMRAMSGHGRTFAAHVAVQRGRYRTCRLPMRHLVPHGAAYLRCHVAVGLLPNTCRVFLATLIRDGRAG